MANEVQLAILRQGVEVWNKWREENIDIRIDLSKADLARTNLIDANFYNVDLTGANLKDADLRGANFTKANLSATNLSEANLVGVNLIGENLSGADLSRADLYKADLSETDLRGANLSSVNSIGVSFYHADLRRADLSDAHLIGTWFVDANLSEANLSGAHLSNANLSLANFIRANLTGVQFNGVNLTRANLRGVDLSGIDLTDADLREADLTKANLCGANLTNVNLVYANINDANLSKSKIYGVNVWDLKGEFKEQKDLIITPDGVSVITVDNIKVAQFIYLILNNGEIRDAINTLTSKSVLILGRFSLPERKSILDALRNKLREYNLLPIVFDFDRPADKDFTETIKTLAGLSYFVIADVTNPKSSPLELQATVPDYQIPFVPIIQEGELPFAMMVDLQKKYNWVLPTVAYDSMETLIKVLKPLIIDPAMKKRNELRIIKAQVPDIISGKDFLETGKV